MKLKTAHIYESRGEKGMILKSNRMRRQREPLQKACFVGLAAGAAVAFAGIAIVSYLIMKGYLKQDLGWYAYITVPAIVFTAASLTAAMTEKKKRLLAGLITTGMMLTFYGIVSLLLPGKTGRGWLIGAVIGLACGLLSAGLSARRKRTAY